MKKTIQKKVNPTEEFGFSLSEGSAQKAERRALCQSEIRSISEYLQNPTNVGVWTLSFKLSAQCRFCDELLGNFEKMIKGKKAVEISAGHGKMGLKVDSDRKKQWKSSIIRQLSFFNSFFLRLYQTNRKQVSSLEEFFSGGTQYEGLLQILDTQLLKRNFQPALDYYSKHITCDKFSPVIKEESVFCTKNGFMLCNEVLDKDEIREFLFSSFDHVGLREYAEFLKLAGRIDGYQLVPIYSPEEQVFAPYFGFLRIAAPFVINDTHVKQLFQKAFGEYEGKNYSNCIGTIGLIAEDYLTQVLETFFREASPKGLTMGQLYEHIHSRLNEKYSKPESQPKDLNSLYKEIATMMEEVKKNPSFDFCRGSLELTRSLLGIIKDDRALFERKMDKIRGTPKRVSFFSPALRDNLTDLIRFRNAVSHRTMIPIGSYEALRSVFCLMSLVMWWGKEKTATNWKLTADEIIRESIYRNTGIAV